MICHHTLSFNTNKRPKCQKLSLARKKWLFTKVLNKILHKMRKERMVVCLCFCVYVCVLGSASAFGSWYRWCWWNYLCFIHPYKHSFSLSLQPFIELSVLSFAYLWAALLAFSLPSCAGLGVPVEVKTLTWGHKKFGDLLLFSINQRHVNSAFVQLFFSINLVYHLLK